jgi:hypothetical protein
VAGRSLFDHIQEKGQLDEREALDIAGQMASALAEAHRKSIIHRDIKPDNVMIDDGGRVRVLDFGLAKPLRQRTRLTSQGAIMGTPYYLAPEQLRGSAVGPATDIYALGITVYEMLAGRPPFAESDNIAAMYRTVHELLPEITQWNRDVSPGVVQLVKRMTAREPENRYADASQMLEDIDQLKQGASSTPPPPVPERRQSASLPPIPSLPEEIHLSAFEPAPPHKGRLRHAVLFLCAIALVTAVVAGLLWMGRQEPPETNPIDFSGDSPFADPKLEAAVREALGNPMGPITPGQLATIAQLDAQTRGIRDLAGLEYCAHLEVLDLASDYAESDMNRNQLENIQPLRKLRSLRTLSIQGNHPLKSETIEVLTTLPGLRTLHADRCDLSEEDVLRLAEMDGLQGLFLSHNPGVTDDVLKHIASMSALTHLEIDECRNVTDAGLRNLAQSTSLTRIGLPTSPAITNEGLRALTGMRTLESLMIMPPLRLNGESMNILAQIPSLRGLDLYQVGALMDDEALERLKSMRNLKWVSLNGPYKAEYVIELRRALPNCEILPNFGLPPDKKEAAYLPSPTWKPPCARRWT